MAKKFNEETKQRFKEAFTLYDKTRKGVINASDVGDVVRILGFNPTQSDIEEWLEEIDPSHECVIDFKDFLKIMGHDMRKIDNEETLRQALRMFDRAGDGFLNYCELRHIMVNLGEKLTEREFNDLVKEIGIDKDEVISIDNFVKIILNKSDEESVSDKK